jgi:hypothetical protein
MTFKKKKISLLISIINLLLAFGILFSYMVSCYLKAYPDSNIFTNEFSKYFYNQLFSYNYSETKTYLIILSFYMPFVYCIAGLFGKLNRFVNILPVIGFTSTIVGYIAFQGAYASNQEFLNFAYGTNTAFSCIFFIGIIGFISSIINLVKSK